MGRDKVLGLSLAILLIGFAGAFCFRNEQFVENGLKLARSKLLDELVAQRPGPKPYAPDPKSERTPNAAPPVTLNGIESIDPPDDVQTTRSTADAKPIQMANPRLDDASFNPPPPDQVLSSSPPPASPEWVPDRPKASTIQIRPTARRNPVDLRWQQNASWQSGGQTQPADDGDSSDTKVPRPAPLVHRVQQGDTLTKLAQRYLGDASRYYDIFAANRDQLQSPNDRLRVGMALRIPRDRLRSAQPDGPVAGRKTVRSTNISNKPDPTARQNPIHNVSRTRPNATWIPADDPVPTTPPADDKSPPSNDRFVPVRKSPFLPRNSQSQLPARPSGRSLSQTPPDNLPEENPSDLFLYQYFPKGDAAAVVSSRPTMRRSEDAEARAPSSRGKEAVASARRQSRVGALDSAAMDDARRGELPAVASNNRLFIPR